MASFGDPKTKHPKMKRKYEIQLCCEGDFNETLVVMESPVICSPVFRPTVPEDILRKTEIKGISLAEGSLVNDNNQVEIDILVGLDYYWKLVKPKISVLSPHLSAQETKIGWILSGSWEERGQKKQVSHQFLCMGDVRDSLCRKIWDVETIGITQCDDKGSENKVNDLKTLENFNEVVQFTEGRYVVHLPWKDGQHDKLTNITMKQLLGRDVKISQGSLTKILYLRQNKAKFYQRWKTMALYMKCQEKKRIVQILPFIYHTDQSFERQV